MNELQEQYICEIPKYVFSKLFVLQTAVQPLEQSKFLPLVVRDVFGIYEWVL
jgi:hypothetical protein